jgi:hypothetical protein
MTVREVAQALQAAEPGVLLVSPRVLQRVIRIDRRLPTFGLSVPHRKCYFLSRQRLLDIVSRFELELDVDHTITEDVILLERPDEEELLERKSGEILLDCWRNLFHVRVHLALEPRIADGRLTGASVLERLQRIGASEYAEIRSVLQRDEMLLPPRSDLSVYVEFAALFLELWYFAPEQIGWYFPSLRDTGSIALLLQEDLDHVALYKATRIKGAAELTDLRRGEDGWQASASEPGPHVEILDLDPLKRSPPAYWRLLARAERVGSVGNLVKAAILRKKASRQALPDRVRGAESLAHAELERLARRLRPVLGLSDDETHDWAAALAPLLEHADQGLRSSDARLLYDLQKVCVEHERGVYAVDLIGWARSWGRTPIRRPLPLLRQVLVTKHLQSASRKLTTSRLRGEARSRLALLIQSAADRAKQLLRDRVRPRIRAALSVEGLEPRSVPERVAFDKIVEELLDRVVEHGHLNMGHLRDTLSQNNLKLQDLTSLWELLFGDLLLRIDRQLAEKLDGIYHRGPIYLRMSQRLSSLAFGTPLGRGLTRYAALPFGGAFLIVESCRHIVHLFIHRDTSLTPEFENVEQLTSVAPPTPERSSLLSLQTWSMVLVLGLFLMLLIENAAFRHWCLRGLRRLALGCRKLFIDLPARLLRLPWVRKLLDSPFYAVVMNYLLKPLAVTVCFIVPYERSFGRLSWGTESIVFLAVNLLFNSPLGRFAEIWISEQLVRIWRELQMRVFAAAVRMVVDLFQWVLQTMEQVLYTVDEWLRFRTGESRWVLAIKALLGVVWGVITYVVRIYITLLIEPQVNPIKHFPVVTVSHKVMLPLSKEITSVLAAPLMPLGAVWAYAIAVPTVFLLPGVFGFLVWELKENWRLYASTRPRNLKPSRIGSHNESMTRLLRLGFHSGTVPRLYARLRQAARKADHSGNWKAVHKQGAALHHVEEAVCRFVERELLALLAQSPAWRDVRLQVREVKAACHQVTVELWHGDSAYEPLRLVYLDRGGWLLASFTQRAWLEAQEEPRRRTFMLALEGLYRYAGVELDWDQLADELRVDGCWYDLNPDGLLIWRECHDATPVLIQLRDTEAAGGAPAPREIIVPSEAELPQFLTARTPISWQLWVDSWSEEAALPIPANAPS